jgi:phage FluMu protein Com
MRQVENPFENPVQNGRRIVAGTGSVRDHERKDDRAPSPPGAPDDGEPLRCGKCGRTIKACSIRPGAVRCPRCRPEAVVSVIIDRGTEAPTTPEERRRIQEKADAERAAALAPKTEREMTREHVIEIAAKNGALSWCAARIKSEFERVGEFISENEALALAKDVVANFGSTDGGRRGRPNYPHLYGEPGVPWAYQKLELGRHPSGRRVTASGDVKVMLPGGDGTYKENLKRELPPPKLTNPWSAVMERVEKLQAARALSRAVVELEAADAGNSDRQRQAHVLVRVRGLSLAEAGRRLNPPASKQAIAKLLAKFDKSTKSATSQGG